MSNYMLILPDEIILQLGEHLYTEGDVSRLSRANRRLQRCLDPLLYCRNARDSGGSALLWAATHGEEHTARKAINVETNSPPFDKAIVLAAEHRRLAVLRVLLSCCARDNEVWDAGPRPCREALMIAIRLGFEDVVEAMISSGKIADFDARNGWEWNYLFQAVYSARASIMKRLLKWGHTPIDARCRMGRTALIQAAMYGHFEIARILLEASSANVNLEDLSDRTALYTAAMGGFADIVKALISTRGIALGGESRPPLCVAAMHGRTNVIQVLLESGRVDVNQKDEDGDTALHSAAYNGQEECVQVLLETRNINVNALGADGMTPIMYAMENGHTSIVQILEAYQPPTSLSSS